MFRVTGYAPVGAGSEMGGSDGLDQGAGGDRGLGASESSDAESDYDEDSNDSSASEEHPILSKFFNLISGGTSLSAALLRDGKHLVA